jgi:mono/diheme cytochrome c family protein
MMSGLTFTLVVVIIARSPYTHGDLSPEGYKRTDIVYVGEEKPFQGFSLKDPQLTQTGDPVQDGRLLFFRYGCAACHGLQGQGGVVGKEIAGASTTRISRKVREGPKTMPAFDQGVLPDSDLEKLAAFLQSEKQ